MSNQISLTSHRSKGVSGMYSWRARKINISWQRGHCFLLSWHRGFRIDLTNSQIQDTGEGPADPRFHSLREQSKEVSNEARGGSGHSSRFPRCSIMRTLTFSNDSCQGNSTARQFCGFSAIPRDTKYMKNIFRDKSITLDLSYCFNTTWSNRNN